MFGGLLVLLIVLAACGGSGSSDASTGPPVSAPDQVALIDEDSGAASQQVDAAGLPSSSTPLEITAEAPSFPAQTNFVLKPIVVPTPQHLMPDNRIVAFYGVPGVPGMGTLGSGSPNDVLARLMATAYQYSVLDKPVIPAFEIMATVAQASPGYDGDYSHPIPVQQLWDYLDVIRTVDGIMIVDFQTGRQDYMDQVPLYEELLLQPDVHVALDPEWDMGPGQVPNQVIGQSDASSINAVMTYLDGLIVANNLPPKIVILHQFQHRMITNRDQLSAPDTVQMVLHMDGHGPPSMKWQTYTSLAGSEPFVNAFKLFYQRDIPLMSPADALALDPAPDLISYQ